MVFGAMLQPDLFVDIFVDGTAIGLMESFP